MAVFASQHFTEAAGVATLVPKWLPGHLFWHPWLHARGVQPARVHTGRMRAGRACIGVCQQHTGVTVPCDYHSPHTVFAVLLLLTGPAVWGLVGPGILLILVSLCMMAFLGLIQ